MLEVAGFFGVGGPEIVAPDSFSKNAANDRARSQNGKTAGWGGAVSGVITFVALASVGYLVVSVPGFPGVEAPHNVGRALAANELASCNVGDYLAGGVSHLVIVGAPFCNAAGALGCGLGRTFRSE